MLVSPGKSDLAAGLCRGERKGAAGAPPPLLPGTMAIISREIGSGVVPMTPEERNWRELHGQVLQALANRADRVFRIFCGLPEVLK